MANIFEIEMPEKPVYVSTRSTGIVNMEVVKELGIVSIHHKLPLTMYKNPSTSQWLCLCPILAEQQLKMLSVQLEQGRHGAITQAQAEVRTRGGNALLGVTFSVNLCSLAGPIVILTGSAVTVE